MSATVTVAKPGTVATQGVNRRILQAATSIAAATVVVKIAATLKEVTVAGAFGRSDAMDAFLAAFLIPNLLINLFAESMNQALVPTLIRVRITQGYERAQQLLSSSMLWLSGLLVAASVAMAVLARVFFPLIASGFPAGKLDLAVRLFYGLLPVVLLSGVASNCIAVLNTCERFAVPALTPAVMPLSIIAGAWLLQPALGIWALVYATLFGALLHAGLAGWMMQAHGYRFSLWWHGSNEATREVAHQYGPVLLSAVVASGGLLVDQAMAAMLPAGSVSALVFANRFVSVVVTLLAGAVASALTPYFSAMIAGRDWQSCRRTLRTWSRNMAVVSVPVAALLIAGAQPLVRFTLQHGAFGSRDTTVVKTVLAMYAIQIPFFVVSRVFYRFVVAMRRTDLIFYCGGLNLALDVVLNLVLMRWMGVAGIALATSLWTVSTLAFLWYWSNRLLTNAEHGDSAHTPMEARP
ncbi:MAG TPA: lipid II flippase MurJ [Terracidiphilus sp.]|nr:lipid II flippase MurJ [Terracidiphilus sp.]